MRGKNWLAVLVRVVCLVILMVACVAEVYGSSTGIQSQTPKKSQSDDISDSNQNDTDIAQELLNEIELTDVQNMLDELLGEDSFSMKDALIKLTKGEQAFSKEAVQGVVYRFFFIVWNRRGDFWSNFSFWYCLRLFFPALRMCSKTNRLEISVFLSFICWFLHC